jgi:hypothetical protein
MHEYKYKLTQMDMTFETCPLIQTKKNGMKEGNSKGCCELRTDLSLVHVRHKDDSKQPYNVIYTIRQTSPFT